MSSVDYWIRQSPYFQATLRAGCNRYSFANHMYQPASYGDPLEAYWKLANDVTLWDVGTERQVEITGVDAFAFTDMLTPRDVSKCAVGRCRYVLITTPEGGIVNDPVMLRLGPGRFWLSTSDSDLLLWAKGVSVNSGMDVQIEEPDVSPVQIQGPKSPGLIEALFGGRVNLAPYELVETNLDGIPVVVSRTGWSGEVGGPDLPARPTRRRHALGAGADGRRAVRDRRDRPVGREPRRGGQSSATGATWT